MKVTIHTDDSISVDSTITGYSVIQASSGTRVFKNHNNAYPYPKNLGDVVQMPRLRYTLSSDIGRVQFEKDFLTIWNASSNAIHYELANDALNADLQRILDYPDLIDKALFADLQRMRFIRSAPSYFLHNSSNPELRLFTEMQAAKNSGVSFLIDQNATEVAKVLSQQVDSCCDQPEARQSSTLDYYPILRRVLCTHCAMAEFGVRLGFIDKHQEAENA
jgi:hypothetical protein